MEKLRVRTFVLPGLGAVALAVTLGQTASATTSPGPVDVKVTNTPLPVTGVIQAAGIIAATQAGTWNVGISGTPEVTGTVTANQGGTWTVGIAGTPTVQLPASRAIRVGVQGIGGGDTLTSWQNTTGRLAVFDYISCIGHDSQFLGLFVDVVEDGTGIPFYYVYRLNFISTNFYQEQFSTKILVKPDEYIGTLTHGGCLLNGHTEPLDTIVTN